MKPEKTLEGSPPRAGTGRPPRSPPGGVLLYFCQFFTLFPHGVILHSGDLDFLRIHSTDSGIFRSFYKGLVFFTSAGGGEKRGWGRNPLGNGRGMYKNKHSYAFNACTLF